ncbi:hypothetical protein SNEBB_008657 [Seison nebaliae]|nr:hypothetical protein SNEBB_008657 [Seison nebaliae]
MVNPELDEVIISHDLPLSIPSEINTENFSTSEDLVTKLTNDDEDDDEDDDSDYDYDDDEEEEDDCVVFYLSGSTENKKKEEGNVNSNSISAPALGVGNKRTKTGVDINQLGTLGTTIIYDYDLYKLPEKEKPWKTPDADLTDYFNYGFNEESWSQYCRRQRALRILNGYHINKNATKFLDAEEDVNGNKDTIVSNDPLIHFIYNRYNEQAKKNDIPQSQFQRLFKMGTTLPPDNSISTPITGLNNQSQLNTLMNTMNQSNNDSETTVYDLTRPPGMEEDHHQNNDHHHHHPHNAGLMGQLGDNPSMIPWFGPPPGNVPLLTQQPFMPINSIIPSHQPNQPESQFHPINNSMDDNRNNHRHSHYNENHQNRNDHSSSFHPRHWNDNPDHSRNNAKENDVIALLKGNKSSRHRDHSENKTLRKRHTSPDSYERSDHANKKSRRRRSSSRNDDDRRERRHKSSHHKSHRREYRNRSKRKHSDER